MEIREQVREIAESKLKDPRHFVVDVVVSLRSKHKVLVTIDGDAGVTIDDCADLSRAMSDELDQLPGLDDRYLLEVSTPGVDQPLRYGRQYAKHVGRTLKVTVRSKPGEVETKIEGKLVNVSSEAITLEQTIGSGRSKEIKTTEVQFSDIEKSFVIVSFK